MSVTLITSEVLTRQRTGFNYWNIPGVEDQVLYKVETLDECIKRLFGITGVDIYKNIDKRGKKGGVIYARHLKRYIMERLTLKNTISDKPRTLGCNDIFKYNIEEIARICGGHYSNIPHSSKVARMLIETDSDFREKVNEVTRKISLNLIIFPEL